jgi:ArsR family transcriptional regulator, arsenate/arsenite/antimonite-responsive transcriptional repressor
VHNFIKISRALGDAYRLKILEVISKQQDWVQCVEIVAMFELSQSTVSHHVKQLLDADLLIAEKDGRNVRYIINKEVFGQYIAYLTKI